MCKTSKTTETVNTAVSQGASVPDRQAKKYSVFTHKTADLGFFMWLPVQMAAVFSVSGWISFAYFLKVASVL